jgi:hypothetical protein
MPVPGSRAGPAAWCMENGDAIDLTTFYGVVAIQGKLNENRLANHTSLDMCVRCSLPTETRSSLPRSLQFIHPARVLSSLGQCIMVSRLETYPRDPRTHRISMDTILSLLSHTHDIDTARVRAIKMHSFLGMIDTSIESRRYHDSQWMLLIPIRTVHLYSQLA